ncbi:MAG: hypothetical protein IT430_20405 [Phycisphaerales bacterium]|nr:hypothetical protein [Phycisphaerales bacterium]
MAWVAIGSVTTSSAALAAVNPPPQIQLPAEVDLARLVDLCAARMGLAIEYDAAVLKGRATLRLTDSLTDAELWELTNRILALRGFTTVSVPGQQGDQMLSVVRVGDAAGLVGIGSSASRAPAGFVAVVKRVEHQSPARIVEALKPVLSRSGGSVVTLGESDLLLITDFQPRVRQAVELLERIDTPGPAPTVERIATRHLPAARLAAMLSSIAAARDGVTGANAFGRVIAEPGDRAVVLIALPEEVESWRALIEQFDRIPAVETRTYSPRYFGLDEVAALVEQTVKPAGAAGDQWRLVRDELTGSIILTATPDQHEQAHALVERLNAAPVESRRPMRSFQVRNRPVAEVIGVLERLMSAGVITEAAASGESQMNSTNPAGSAMSPDVPRTVPGTEPQPTPAEPATGRDTGAAQSAKVPRDSETPALTLTADEATSTIIAMGEPRLLDQVRRLIDELDVRQPQVMVEILIVSLTDSQTLDLGVELEKIEVSGDVRITLSSLFGLSSVTDGIRSVGNARGGSALVLSPGDFSVVVRALETVNDGRSLNVPRVLVNNNQQASLNSVLQQPFVSINAFDTIATTSFGGTQDAGTVVTVKPQIAEGDHLIVDYSVTLSAFVGESADPSLPPPRQENRLQSIATIPDGYVVALGGIEVTSRSKGVSQVPGLAGIPIVGELFKNRSRTESRSRFYIFIRPSVLRRLDFEDLRYLSEAPMEAGGIDDGWPVVEPRVIH